MYATVQRFYRGSAFTNTIQGHNGLCNIAPYAYNTSDNVHFYIDNNQVNVFIPPDTDTSTVIQVCATLATPLTIQLDPHTLSLLLGENNIWCDTGDTSIGYRADTKLYIERLTQPTEDDMVANTNIASGKYFMVGNSLFKSTASIASGDAIVPETNCTAMSLADALNAINA